MYTAKIHGGVARSSEITSPKGYEPSNSILCSTGIDSHWRLSCVPRAGSPTGCDKPCVKNPRHLSLSMDADGTTSMTSGRARVQASSRLVIFHSHEALLSLLICATIDKTSQPMAWTELVVLMLIDVRRAHIHSAAGRTVFVELLAEAGVGKGKVGRRDVGVI